MSTKMGGDGTGITIHNVGCRGCSIIDPLGRPHDCATCPECGPPPLDAWEAYEARFEDGVYDLGDLRLDTETARTVYLHRPEWEQEDAETCAGILRRLGYLTSVNRIDRGWEITVRRLA